MDSFVRKSIYFLPAILFLFLFYFLLFFIPEKTFAQYCSSGTYWCGNKQTSCTAPDGSSCVPSEPNDPFCTCAPGVCQDQANGSCSTKTNQAACTNPCASYSCTITSCSWTPASSGGGGTGGGGGSTSPYCGDGICNNGETQYSCSTDCGAPPPTVTRTYNQCGGTCNGTSYSANQSVYVKQMSDGTFQCSLNATCSTGCDTSTGTCATVTRTYNQCGGNCNGTSYGANVTENITENNTNGSYTYTCNSHSTCSNGCDTSTGTCTTSTRTYNQCGGNCNGTSYGANVTENITSTTNPDGSTTFVCNSHSTCTNGCDTGTGQCVASTTPAPTVAPTQPPATSAVCNQSYGTCGCSSNCKDGANTDYSCCHREWGACTSGTQACITVFGAGAQQCSNGASQSCSSSALPTTTCVNPQWQCHTWDSTRCPDGSYYHDEQCGTSAPYSYYQFCDGQCPVSTAPPADNPPPPPVFTCSSGCPGCQICVSGTCIDPDPSSCPAGNKCSGGVCVPIPGGTGPHYAHVVVWTDTNNNGIYDPLTDGVQNASVTLASSPVGGATSKTGSTDSSGKYSPPSSFQFTEGSTYYIWMNSMPDGFTMDPSTPLNPIPASKLWPARPYNQTYQSTSSSPTDVYIYFKLDSTAPPPSTQSTISGILYQNGGICTGGTPLAGATVRLIDSNGNPVGSPITTDSTGKYTFTASNANNYSLAFANTLGASLQYAHTSSCTPKTGNTYTFNLAGNQTIDFYFNNFAPWFQTDLGDVRMGYLSNKVPGGSTASTSTTNPSIFYSTNSDPEFGTGGASAKGWSVGSEYIYNDSSTSRNGSSAYTFYKSRATETGVGIKSISDLSQISGSGVYELSGGAINNAYTVPNGQHIVILVPADLTINASLKVPSGVGSLLIVAAKGNLTIGAGVGESSPSSTNQDLQGIYTSEKNIILAGTGCSAGTPDKRLNVGGVLIANALRPFDSGGGGKIQNQRSLCTVSSGNGTYPSLFVASRLDFITQLTSFYKTTYQKWEEVQP